MLKFLIAILVLDSARMTHGLNLKKLYTDSSSPFGLFECLRSMPYLKYTAYEGASFCRVYTYSCNNLWPEELNTEVTEGTFCLINAWEQGTDYQNHNEQLHQMHDVVRNVVAPWYLFMMDFFSFTRYGDAALAVAEKMAAMRTPDEKDVEIVSKKIAVKEADKNDPDNYHIQIQDSCQDSTSSTSQLNCMIRNMKLRLSEVGNAKPNLSNISSDRWHQLFNKAQNVTSHLELVDEAKRITNEHDAIAGKGWPGIPGPIVTSLGKRMYTNSWMQGFVGPVSAKHRNAWDAVQPGLIMEKFDLSTVDKRAVCNDGSPAGLFLRELSKTKWHFHIDGGFFCFDRGSCLGRARFSSTLVSTKGWEQRKNNSGMFDPHLGGFPDYTHGTIGYCSSDAWMGQVEIDDFTMVGGTKLSNNKYGTYFHGYFVLQAVLQKFIMMGMGDTPGQELFVSGCSAGSIGATAMADSWVSRLQAFNIKNVPRIWTLLDGAPIVNPPATLYPGQHTIVEMALSLVKQLYGPGTGASPGAFINQKCVAANQDRPETCVWTATVLPFIQTPNIVLNQLWDNFVTGEIFFFFNPTSPTSYKTGLTIAKLTRETMATVSPVQNYHAVGCGDHCVSANPNFWRILPNTAANPISARDMTIETRDGMLNNDRSLLGRVVTDTCDHYNCGCIGQSSSYNALAGNTLFMAVLNTLNPSLTQAQVPATVAMALAADQTANPGQFAFP